MSATGHTTATVARLRPFASTIFAEMTALAVTHDAVNLGQGFPDTDGPTAMLDVARAAITSGVNQYPPGPGIAELRGAIAADRLRRYATRYDPDDEILVTVGATEAISAAILGLVEPGSQVLLIEPYYDSYAAAVAMAGAERTTAPMRPDGDRFVLDVDALRAAVTPRTRMIILNTPHNPTAAVLSDDELRAVADLACEHDLIVLSDEVYEHLVFDGRTHRPIATLAGMAERTITVSSAGKMFNVTGWKIGWALGPANLISAVRTAKQFLSFTAGAPLQPAVAYALEQESAWVSALREDLQRKRDTLRSALTDAGFGVYQSEGTYFVCADISTVSGRDGVEFCRELPARIGVAAIPISVFTDHPNQWNRLVRFAFCKQDPILAEAATRLRGLRTLPGAAP